MNNLITEKSFLIINSVFFLLTPIALTLHLNANKNKPNTYKKRLGYIYGGIWAIAFLNYVWLLVI
ncbi:MAG: hypothetical protein Tsb0014_39300 [Pleurocapsa sp.]